LMAAGDRFAQHTCARARPFRPSDAATTCKQAVSPVSILLTAAADAGSCRLTPV